MHVRIHGGTEAAMPRLPDPLKRHELAKDKRVA